MCSEYTGGVLLPSLVAEVTWVGLFRSGSFIVGGMLTDSLSIAVVEEEVAGSNVILSSFVTLHLAFLFDLQCHLE